LQLQMFSHIADSKLKSCRRRRPTIVAAKR
jgi:hypothetical protein